MRLAIGRKIYNFSFSYVSNVVQETHFWTLCSNYYCGGLKLEVSANADPKYIVRCDYVLWEGYILSGCCVYGTCLLI
jgi:hypothetical protein